MSQSTAVQLSYDSNAAYRRGDYAAAEQLALQALRVDKKMRIPCLFWAIFFISAAIMKRRWNGIAKCRKWRPGMLV